MSGVWGWFGGSGSQSKKDSPKNAILGLRSQLEMLQKRENHLQLQMDQQDAIAREKVSTNKNGRYTATLLRSDVDEYSCEGCLEEEEATRTYTRTDNRADCHSRTADILHRGCKHQQRDVGSHGEGRQGHGRYPWQAEYR